MSHLLLLLEWWPFIIFLGPVGGLLHEEPLVEERVVWCYTAPYVIDQALFDEVDYVFPNVEVL